MNPAWVETYLGLIHQVDAVAFVVLGVIAGLTMRHQSDSPLEKHLGWLAAFGVLHGLQAYIDGARPYSPAIWLAVLSALLTIISFAALMEFGRRLWNERPNGRQISATPLYISLAIIAAIAVFTSAQRMASLELCARYLLGAPGALLASIGLFYQASLIARASDTSNMIRWLHVGSGALAIYAALTLVLPAEAVRSLLYWLPSTDGFLALTGLPIQLARAACALSLVVAFFNINRIYSITTSETLRRVTDQLDGFVYRCRNDAHWTVTFMSNGGEALTGYPTRDFLAGERHFADQIHSDDQQRVWEEVQAAVAIPESFRLQYRMIDRTGVVRWCHEEGRGIFNSKGELLYLEGLVRNDEERHQAEADLTASELQYRQLFELSSDGIVYADRESTNFIVSNQSFADMLGYRQEDIPTLSVKDIHYESVLSHVAQQFDALASGLIRVAEDIPVMRRDGSIFFADISAFTGVLEGRQLLVGIFRDVSERKSKSQRIQELNQELEARVLERTGELERANAAKSDFLSRMSHELRTPLNAILGFSQLLQLPTEPPMSESHSEYAFEIRRAGEHLLSLVNEVLDLARIDSGQLVVNLESVALDTIIAQCTEQMGPEAKRRRIVITRPKGVCGPVLADPMRLRQVLINLLSNAVKYNREGGLIELGCANTSGEMVRVSVRDTGRGLSDEQQQRLFRPFERLESAYEGIDGTGIGLALAKQLVEGMQGHIGVDSQPGAGSTFWFELPQCDAPEHFPDDAVSTSHDTPLTGSISRKVLCVEDNPANLLLVEKLLRKRTGVDLFTATNAEDGLALARQTPPDLILLDINLPDMNGYQLLERLKSDSRLMDIPVIAFSANAMQGDIERGKAAGFTDYITKPLDITKFYKAVEAVLASIEGMS